MSFEEQSLKDLLFMAYRVQFYQLSTPGWMETTYFNVRARVPVGATRDGVAVMLQGLLAERFALKVHHAMKETPGYTVVVGKNGIKAVPSAPIRPVEPIGADGGTRHFALDKNGFAVLPPGKANIITIPSKDGLIRLTASEQTIDGLCGYLSRQLQQPVINQTGLNGAFDFHLEFARDGIALLPPPSGGGQSSPFPAQEEPAPTLIQAVEKQLGLKMAAMRVPTDTLIIDHINRMPVEN